MLKIEFVFNRKWQVPARVWMQLPNRTQLQWLVKEFEFDKQLTVEKNARRPSGTRTTAASTLSLPIACRQAAGGQFQHLACDLVLPFAALADQIIHHSARVARCSVHGDQAAGLLTRIRLGCRVVETDISELTDEPGDEFRVGQIAVKRVCFPPVATAMNRAEARRLIVQSWHLLAYRAVFRIDDVDRGESSDGVTVIRTGGQLANHVSESTQRRRAAFDVVGNPSTGCQHAAAALPTATTSTFDPWLRSR